MAVHRCLIGLGGGLSEDRLELGKELLNRVEVWAVWREVEKECTARLDCLADAGDLVNADVVHDDDVAALERWNENLFDIGQEAWAIHRPIQQQRGRDTVMP